MTIDPQTTVARQVYTVSELTDNIKDILEENFSFIWISGEISNTYIPASGHYYLNLKDGAAQIQAVIFRGQVRHLKFTPENGMAVIGLGRISVYPPRGAYQIILEYLEPSGLGALHIAFEQLKKKLAAEGLFDEQIKKPLPPLPGTIGVVTSLSGAVIHDIMTVLFRRFENIHLLIAPARVQGVGAETEIAEAIERLNRHGQAELMILARGGGSLEDLQAFNSETVARAIQASRIPVVSAVGHEVDYTIADFCADLRAPTPSAAAENVVPVKADCVEQITALTERLARAVRQRTASSRADLAAWAGRLKSPRRYIEDMRLRLDHLFQRLTGGMAARIDHEKRRKNFSDKILYSNNPVSKIDNFRELLDHRRLTLMTTMQMFQTRYRYHLDNLDKALHALSPMAVLDRGYSITRTVADDPAQVIRNADAVTPGQPLEIMLARGTLYVHVVARLPDKS